MMPVFIHELKRNKIALLIWALVIAGMLSLSIIIYPEMASEMDQFSEMFSNMGNFSSAFGMDQLNFGEYIGFFAVECGNVLGLGGSFFAAITGISMLSKEEKDGTASFLLSHPISRKKIVFEKLISLYIQILVLNLIVLSFASIATFIIGEKIDIKLFLLIFLAYFLMQIEISSISFGISAFLKTSGMGIGLGIALLFYFLNIVSNLTKEAKFLKYITPFGFTEGGDIIANSSLEIKYLLVGLSFTIIGIFLAFYKYNKKDIA